MSDAYHRVATGEIDRELRVSVNPSTVPEIVIGTSATTFRSIGGSPLMRYTVRRSLSPC